VRIPLELDDIHSGLGVYERSGRVKGEGERNNTKLM
jgi:hypothetical protein